MITEKDINKAAREYTESSTIDGRIPYGIDDAEVLHEAFTYGIEWYKKNLWHFFKEEPQMDEQVFCIDTKNEALLLWSDGDWKEKVGIYEIVKWCYVKDLLL